MLTALGLERQAVLAHLENSEEAVHPEGTIYWCGQFQGKQHHWQVAVAEIGMGGTSAATETERAISYFHPQYAFFVGVAGGLKDVKLGDVVAATKVYAYESGKEAQTFEARPEVWKVSYALEQRAKAVSGAPDWQARLPEPRTDPVPSSLVGAIAAGEKVIASQQASIYKLLRTTYGDALAVEMEGHGLLQAVRANQQVSALVVRGISDLVVGKKRTDKEGWQPIAARHAAAFAFEVLHHLTPPISPSPSAMSRKQQVQPTNTFNIGEINTDNFVNGNQSIGKQEINHYRDRKQKP
jgi:nucleoside phosphorylase